MGKTTFKMTATCIHKLHVKFEMKPVLMLSLLLVLSSYDGLVITRATAEPGSSSPSGVNHNRIFSDSKLRKNYDPYDDDFGKESSNTKRLGEGDIIDSGELERVGGASGKPLSTSVKENLVNLRDTTGCPPEFDGLCRCDYNSNSKNERKFTVNCTSAGFSSAKVLESLPENTEVLIFTGNNLQSLPANVFGNKKVYPDLVYIDLSSNGIENILGKTFHRVNSTLTLLLNNNKISRYTLRNHQRIFSNFVNLENLHLSTAFEENEDLISDLSEVFIESNLTKLKKLHLEHNGVDYINKPDIFCELPSLMDLHLSQNNLSDLNLDLTCLNNVRYIDITYNNIKTIDENSGLWKLLHENNRQGDQIHVNLYQNQFECDCRMDLFISVVKNWTKANPDVIPYGNHLQCYDGIPNNNTGKYLWEVTHTECPVLHASDYGSTAVSVVAWILGMLFLIGIGYFLYVNQNILCRPVSPLHQTTTQGVKYTTIQEEEAEVAHV